MDKLQDFGLVKDVTAVNGRNNVTIRFTDSHHHEVEYNVPKDDLLAMLEIETAPERSGDVDTIDTMQAQIMELNGKIGMVMGFSCGLRSFLDESHSSDGHFVTLTRDTYDHLRDILSKIATALE